MTYGSIALVRTACLFWSLLLAGCTTTTEFGSDASTGEPAQTDPTTTGLLPTTADPSGLNTTSSSGPGQDPSSTTDDPIGTAFIPGNDAGPYRPIECSVTEQDCPRGEKCNAWANDGGATWNAARCFPLDPDPDVVDEPCTFEGSHASGVDSCDIGSICLSLDVQRDRSLCVPYCVGPDDDLSCEDPTRVCQVSGSGIRPLCFPSCNPLDLSACPEGQSCMRIADSFTCGFDASGPGGAAFDACDSDTVCEPGSSCRAPDFVGACEPGTGSCCTPYCDLTAPACPEPTTCLPHFEDGTAPAGFEDLGACGAGAG